MSRTVYVVERGAMVHRAGHTVEVRVDGSVMSRVPADGLGRVVLWPGTHVTTPALRWLCGRGVEVTLIGGGGRFVGAVVPPLSGGLVRRVAQFGRFMEVEYALDESRRLVRAKLEGQRAALEGLRRRGVDGRAARGVIDGSLAGLGAADLATLRGLEGAAARAWFGVFGAGLKAPWVFERRTRRPPKDPVNALLSLGYVLLGNEIAGDVEGRGFDPRLGVYHQVHPGRPALALDLLEPWRTPVVDALVRGVLNRGQLRVDDFVEVGEGVRLKAPGLRRFLGAYEAMLGGPGAGWRGRIAAWIDGFEGRLLGSELDPDSGEAQ